MIQKHGISRRDFLRLSAITTTGALLAACKSQTAPGSAATPGSKVTTINFLTQSATPDTLQQLEPLLARFKSDSPDIHIQFAVQPGEQNIYEKMTIMHEGGAPADMAAWANQVAIYACAGVFRDIQTFVDRDKLDLTDYYDTHVESLKWGGKLYALPAAVYTTCMYFNKDLFDKAGVPYPPQTTEDAEDWTMEAFLETAKALTVNPSGDRPEQFGVYEIYNNNMNKPQFFGGYSFDQEGNCLMGSPECLQAFQFWADLKFKHQVAPTAAQSQAIGGGVGGDEAPFLSGKVAMAVGGNWSLPALAGAAFNWDVAILPSSAPDGNRSANFSPDAFVMGYGEHPEEVWRFLKWMQEPENIQEWCLTSGAFSPRKSQSDYNANLVSERFGVNGEVINYCLSHATMVQGELRQYGNPNEKQVDNFIKPFFDELELGRITAEQLAESVVDEATKLAKTPCG